MSIGMRVYSNDLLPAIDRNEYDYYRNLFCTGSTHRSMPTLGVANRVWEGCRKQYGGIGYGYR